MPTANPANPCHTGIHRTRPGVVQVCSAGANLEFSVRHYGSESALKTEGGGFRVTRSEASDCAIVTFTSADYWSANVRATPAQLRAMAARLIDAACDIETRFAPEAA